MLILNMTGLILTTLFCTALTLAAQNVSFESSNLPIVVIDTHGQEIPDEYRIVADMGIIYNGPDQRNYLNQSFNHFEGKIAIELRGASSQMFPKKQYRLETQSESGENLNVSLLGLPAENDWILYAPYSDKSLIRNVLIYQLSREIGQYASRTRFCELVLNGEYRGIYVLMEKIKRDKNRVNISKLKADEISGDDLTGGYIIKIDKRAGELVDGWQSIFPPYPQSAFRIFFQYHYPKPDEIVSQQKAYIQNWMFNFELSLFKNTFMHPDSGYYRWVNLNSFIDFFLLNEISKNVDGYRLSTFMYKDKDSKDGRLYMGPIWDFNLGFGNADYYHGYQTTGWQIDINRDPQFVDWNDPFLVPFWWEKIMSDSIFVKKLIQRYQILREDVFSLGHIYQLIDSYVDTLNEAQARNFQRWDVLGKYVWPNYFIGQTYEDEINYLKNWIAERLSWMDSQLFDEQPPTRPGRISVTQADHSSIALTWEAATDNVGIAGYDVYLDGKYLQPTRLNNVTLYDLEDDKTYHITIKSRDFAGNRSLEEAQIIASTEPFTESDGLIVMKTVGAISVDAFEEDQWRQIAWQSVEHVLMDNIENQADLSARFKMLWDDVNLYLLVRVFDDLKIRDSGVNFYQDDGLELLFDMNYGKSNTIYSHTFTYRFTFQDSQFIETEQQAVEGIVYGVKMLDDGYFAELAIPWKTLRKEPAEGQLIGFDLQINDDDDGGRRDSKIGWWEDSNGLGLLKLKSILSTLPGPPRTPQKFVLLRNFPNPFNSGTTLEITTAVTDYFQISLYDLRGRKIKVFKKKILLNAGLHHIRLPMEDMASGIYFVELKGKGRAAVKQISKIMLLK
ncbi:CotH kinase family protein [Calditrichota bacterium GD2]